jgi:hypothetical protein
MIMLSGVLKSIFSCEGKEIKKMGNKKEWRLAVLLVLGLVFILVVNAKLPLEAENRGLAKAVFYVT